MRSFPIIAIGALALFAQCGNAAQRTFVSGAGSDFNPCTISAPCRGFAAALTHTDFKGEIIVLDSAGYGPVTVNKSVSIIAPTGVYAGISVFSGDGVTISGAGIDVVLRGLTINGQGGNRGIVYTFGARLRISNCVVSNMSGEGVVLGWGGEVTIEDSVIRDNGNSGVDILLNPNVTVRRTTIDRNSGRGIRFRPSATDTTVIVTASHISRNIEGIEVAPTNVSATVAVAHSTIARSFAGAISLFSTNAADSITALMSDNTIVQNGYGVYAGGNAGSSTITGSLTDNLLSGNTFTGIATANVGGLLVLDRNTVTHNNVGISRNSGWVIETRSNNTVRENATDLQGAPYTAVGGV